MFVLQFSQEWIFWIGYLCFSTEISYIMRRKTSSWIVPSFSISIHSWSLADSRGEPDLISFPHLLAFFLISETNFFEHSEARHVPPIRLEPGLCDLCGGGSLPVSSTELACNIALKRLVSLIQAEPYLRTILIQDEVLQNLEILHPFSFVLKYFCIGLIIPCSYELVITSLYNCP